MSVIIAVQRGTNQAAEGTWLNPRFDALPPASLSSAQFDWYSAMQALRKATIDPDKPRAAKERAGLLLRCTMKQMRIRPEMEVLVGGNPLSTEFMTWLVALKASRRNPGTPESPLRVRCAASLAGWQNQLGAMLSGSSALDQAGPSCAARFASDLWQPNMHFWWFRGRL